MACLEHACTSCDYTWFNNQRESYCPKCGAYGVTNWFDEIVGNDSDTENEVDSDSD